MAKQTIRVVSAMLEDDQGRYLIVQRLPTASLPLLWEFPGGRVVEGESDRAALARELGEVLGVAIDVGEQAMRVRHEYPNYEIELVVFACRLVSDRSAIRHLKVNDHRWVSAAQMGDYRFPEADARSVERLLGL